MKVGLDQNSTYHLPTLKGVGLLKVAQSLGLEGMQFVDIRDITPSLSLEEIRRTLEHADANDLYICVGIPSINPHNPTIERLANREADYVGELRKHLELIGQVARGSRTVRCVIGGPGDRIRGGIPWSTQVADALSIAKSLAPVLREHGLRLALENHADISTYEAIEFVEAVGPDVAGICLDTGNTMVALEEPLAAVRRCAPYVVATHLKDGIVVFGDQGLTLSPRPVGQGLLPVAEILQALQSANSGIEISIEDYGMLLSIPIFNAAYVQSFAQVSATEVAQIVQLATRCERAVSEGRLESPQAVERVPWGARARTRLSQSASFVRGVLNEMGHVADSETTRT